MSQQIAHQFLSLSLAAMLTLGVLSGLDHVADQQHHSAAAQWASQSVAPAASSATAAVVSPAVSPAPSRS